MSQSNHEAEIPTADAEDDFIESEGWKWPAAYLTTLVLLLPAAGLTVILPDTIARAIFSLVFLAMFATFWGGLYFGLKDFYNVKRSRTNWTPKLWQYFLINFLLTPIVSFSVYLIQRYRHTNLNSELPRKFEDQQSTSDRATHQNPYASDADNYVGDE